MSELRRKTISTDSFAELEALRDDSYVKLVFSLKFLYIYSFVYT